ncbi:VHS domain protein [Aspergillus clavatus NRRL 1]|uniref:VHS domain protein n=1 Tax=Aspergillus clavatus (strain ATCC 1007 / CBS 513.65 / DSM 816 / NCTC 3887 / NRRL 1 / QM 1276 / 107) TaxID=344612 RepID=A1CQZ2_ASPCL|nr:VHS domain protein [Aspergillus clavatus NRRL 1]EAW08063.1 VHS domain protein [Aspergillus clavatus NRRL 1]
MAARDRYGVYADVGLTPLQRAIRNACDFSLYEPNLALNLEVADLINSKKGNSPREAAVEIVRLINSRNQNVALLALALLDICVKNCGYPFHLQISTKEFLNELVRRFPERPPMRPTRVQHRILESIEEWRQTICQTSRYKEDLGHIRDMHRLLLYKGYMFPEIRHEDAAVLNPSDNLRSAEEMEEEDREAQSAKLQELIRRGTPADLQEANRLMKVMAGFDTRHKTDYRAKAAEEVAKVQQKAKILEEMLQSHQPGDPVAEGDVFEELASALQSAHPKIQRMCEEESDDPEAVHKLLEINDSIHRTIERYKLVKKGDFDAAARIPKGTLGTTTGVSKNANNEFSLIDFDPEPSPNGDASQAAPDGSSLENDLLGLSIDEPVPAGGISLGPGPFPGSATPQQQPPAGVKPTYDIMASFNSSRPVSQSSTPAPRTPQYPAATATPPPPAADPFASLMSASPRTASPFRSGASPSSRSHAAASTSLLDLAGAGPSAATPAARSHAKGPEEDEWNFASSLPESNALPTTNRVQVLDSSLRIEFAARRHPSQPRQIHVVALFSNRTSQPLNELHFQVAVEKVSFSPPIEIEVVDTKWKIQAYTLQLRPQSGRDIAPLQPNGVRQEMLLDGVDAGKGNSIKIRFRVSYRVGAEKKEDQGMVPPLGIA